MGARRSKSAPTTPGKTGSSAAKRSASESLIAHLEDLVHAEVGTLAGVERRKVMRSDCWFVEGKIFALVSNDARIVVRLSEASAQEELLAVRGSAPWKIGDKAPMRAWIQLPEAFHDDDVARTAWLKRAWALGTAAKGRAKKKASIKKRT